MSLDRHETKNMIANLLENKRRLDQCMDQAKKLFGGEIIEGTLFTAAYQVLEQCIHLIEKASEPPVDLSWYVWENDCGRNGFEAGPEGDVRAVRTVEDLLDLAEREGET